MSVRSFIYEALDTHEPELADELYESNSAPPFSFSEFVTTAPYKTSDSGLSCQAGYWVFNTSDARILDAIANHARAEELQVGHTVVPVDGVEMEQIEPVTEACYESLSPVFTSIYRDDDRVSLMPNEPMWAARLRDSVKRRMESAGRLPDDFQFDIVEVENWESDGWRINENYVRPCAHCEFTLRTDETTSHFIQRQGIGEGSGVGLSCVIPSDHKPA
jgi:CRISPR-associated endoribonuclease Cas6